MPCRNRLLSRPQSDGPHRQLWTAPVRAVRLCNAPLRRSCTCPLNQDCGHAVLAVIAPVATLDPIDDLLSS